MSDILNEHEADKIVNINLLKEIQRLKGLNKTMGKLLLDVNGDVYFSEVHTLIAESEVESKVTQAREQIAEFEKVNALSDKLKAQTETPATQEPTAPAPAVEAPAPVAEQPATQPEQPQVAPETTEARPEAPVAPQPQPVVIQ